MKEKILDVLLYLVENFFANQSQLENVPLVLTADELERAGFEKEEVTNTFAWLEMVLAPNQNQIFEKDLNSKAFRFYTDYECQRLSKKCRGFLMALEKSGLLDTNTRELIIDYALCLEVEKIDLKILEKIAQIVLFTQKGMKLDNLVISFVIDSYGAKKLLLH